MIGKVVLPGISEEGLDNSVTGSTLTFRAETVPTADSLSDGVIHPVWVGPGERMLTVMP